MPPSSSADRAKKVALAAVVMSALGAAVAACDSLACDLDPSHNKASDFRGGALHTEPSGDKWYETSASDGDHLNFSQGSRVRVHHQLGARPGNVQLWVSFSQDGTKSGNEAPPAGNMTEVHCVDDESILITNNSCADYWLRVVASDPAEAPDGGADGGTCAAQ